MDWSIAGVVLGAAALLVAIVVPVVQHMLNVRRSVVHFDGNGILLTDPLVMFLDEPTSGLEVSSYRWAGSFRIVCSKMWCRCHAILSSGITLTSDCSLNTGFSRSNTVLLVTIRRPSPRARGHR